MTKLTGIYKIPALKCIIFIFSSLEGVLGKRTSLIENEKRKQEIEHILRSKNCTPPIGLQLWKFVLFEQNDFLEILASKTPRKRADTNQTFCIPENLELLAINLLKTPKVCLDFDTHKILSSVPDEDIIEAFI